MTMATDAHPAGRPGPPRRLFITGWGLRQVVLPLLAALLFDLSTGGASWAWLLASAIVCRTLAALILRRAWAAPSIARAEVTAPRRDAPAALLLVSEILAQIFITVLVFALALSSSLLSMAIGILFAAALLGHFAADAANRFLRVSGMLQQLMITRIVVSAGLVVVSVTPGLLAAQTGAEVASVALVVVILIGVAGVLTVLSRSRWRS